MTKPVTNCPRLSGLSEDLDSGPNRDPWSVIAVLGALFDQNTEIGICRQIGCLSWRTVYGRLNWSG